MYAERNVSGASVAFFSLDYKLMNLFMDDTENRISNVLFRVLHNALYKISPNLTNCLQTSITGTSKKDKKFITLDFYC